MVMVTDKKSSIFLKQGSEQSGEIGVGFNTPTIIRFPFEKLVKENKQVNLIRLNLNEAVIPESIEQQAVGINKDIKQTIKDLHTVLSGI